MISLIFFFLSTYLFKHLYCSIKERPRSVEDLGKKLLRWHWTPWTISNIKSSSFSTYIIIITTIIIFFYKWHTVMKLYLLVPIFVNNYLKLIFVPLSFLFFFFLYFLIANLYFISHSKEAIYFISQNDTWNEHFKFLKG